MANINTLRDLTDRLARRVKALDMFVSVMQTGANVDVISATDRLRHDVAAITRLMAVIAGELPTDAERVDFFRVDADEAAFNCKNGNCGRYQTEHLPECEFGALADRDLKAGAIKESSSYAAITNSIIRVIYGLRDEYPAEGGADLGRRLDDLFKPHQLNMALSNLTGRHAWAISEKAHLMNAQTLVGLVLSVDTAFTDVDSEAERKQNVYNVNKSGNANDNAPTCPSCGLTEACHTSTCLVDIYNRETMAWVARAMKGAAS